MFILAMRFSIILCVILVIVYILTNYLSYGDFREKLTAFECGFDPLRKIRSPFSTRFFLLVVLFLIFDVEIALLFPVLRVLITNVTLFTVASLLLFLFILLFGIFHEWNEGALDWFSNWIGKLKLSFWAHNPTMDLYPLFKTLYWLKISLG